MYLATACVNATFSLFKKCNNFLPLNQYTLSTVFYQFQIPIPLTYSHLQKHKDEQDNFLHWQQIQFFTE